MLDTSHRVRKLAYQLWEEQGRPVGRDQENWFEAERLVHSERVLEASDACVSKKEKGQRKNLETKRKNLEAKRKSQG